MASVETNKHEGRYLKLDVTQESQSISGNYSTCRWTVSSIGGSSNYYAIYSASATVHGTVVWNVGTVGWTTKSFPAATGSTTNTFTVWHDNATGTASVGFSLTGGVWSSANVVTRSGSLTLDTIPRNPKISGFSTSAASETSINVSWSSDMTIDYLNYSIDDGANWTRHDNSDSSSGSFTISGLSAGTTYNIKINLHSKTSGLWSGASSRSARKTYSYPTATLPSGSITLNSSTKTISFSFNNPLKRTISYSASCGNYSVSGSTTGTSASLTLNSDSLYNEISGTSATLNVSAWATGLNSPGSITLYTDASYAAPGINTGYIAWEAKHTNNKITVGSNYMIQNLSYLQVRYTSASIISLRKGATSLKSVTFTFGNKTSTLSTTLANHNGTATYNYTAATSATITVTDNRGYSATGTINIPFLPYANPTAGITGERVGGYGENVQLTARGYCSSLNGTNSITKVECRYTRVTKPGTSEEKREEITTDMTETGSLLVTQDNGISTTYWVNVTDKLGNTSGWKNYTTVIAGQPIFFIDEKLKGLGVNCFPSSDGLYINGKRQMQRFDIDLSSQSTGTFYPIVFDETQEFIHCEISSPSLSGSAAWNQNSISFTMKSCGWSDSPVDLIVHSYGRYTNGEITIGCIGRGTSHGEVCIWLRGGMAYNFYSNIEATAYPTGFTSDGDEPVKFMQGTNYYGGSNTRTNIEFTPGATIANGAYFRNGLTVGGNFSVGSLSTTGAISAGGNISSSGNITSSLEISASRDVKAGWSLYAQNGYLHSTANGFQIRIGSRNEGWCHYETGAPAHWFNKQVSVNGPIFKGSGYDVNVPGVRISGSAPAATQIGDIWFVT